MKPRKVSLKRPAAVLDILLDYTKGLYYFFCRNIATVALVVFAILNRIAGNPETATKKDFARLVSSLWIVNHKARKLEGISSISTSVHDNCFCARWRKIKNCICGHCYAESQQSYQTGLKEHNILNGIILRNILIPVCFFRKLVIMFPVLRIESFGDVANVTQARNYIRIIKAFPRKRCAIWTKNWLIWKQALDIEGKPKNCTFVVSSPYVNKPVSKSIIEQCQYIDHIFTVYDKKFATKNGIVINCGGRKCMDCIRKKVNCYFQNTEFYINELLK